MKKYLILFSCMVMFNSSYAQMIVAGDSVLPGILYKTLNYSVSMGAPMGGSDTKYDSLDLNGDGIKDILFYASAWWFLGGGGSSCGFKPLNETSVAVFSLPFLDSSIVIPFDYGDTIDDMRIWYDSSRFFCLEWQSYGAGGSGGESMWDFGYHYLGIRLMSNSSALYGWIQLDGDAGDYSSSVSLKDYGILKGNTGIPGQRGSESFIVSPNPVTDELRITRNCIQMPQVAKLYDNSGKIWLTSILSDGNSIINLKFLPKGIYFLSIDSKGNSIVRKIIKD